MYDPQTVLTAVDGHTFGVLALAGVTIVGMAIWFAQAFIMAKRDRAYSFPIFCTLFWFAHDTSYVARFDTWFHVYDHWFLKLFWAALVVTTLMELVYLRQTLRYGRAELFPHLSQRAYTAVLAGGVAFAMVIWWMVKAAFADELYIIAFGLTVVVYPPFAIALMLRRRSIRGQSPLMWVGFVVLSIGWFTLTPVYFGPTFHSWQWLTIGASSIVGGIAGLWLTTAGARYGLVDGVDSIGAGHRAHPLRPSAERGPEVLRQQFTVLLTSHFAADYSVRRTISNSEHRRRIVRSTSASVGPRRRVTWEIAE